MRRTNDAILGKAVKDIDVAYLKEAEGLYIQKKYLIISLAVIAMLLIFMSVIAFGKNEAPLAPHQTGQVNGNDGFVPFQDNKSTPDKDGQAIGQAAGETSTKLPLVGEEQIIVNEIIDYQVKEGECFAIISTRYYGTEAYAAELARFNRLKTNDILKIGQVVQVPRDAGRLKQ